MKIVTTTCATLAILLTTGIAYAGIFGSIGKVLDTGKRMVNTSSDIVNTVSGKGSSSAAESSDARSSRLLEKYKSELSASYKELRHIQHAYTENHVAAEKNWHGKRISLVVYLGSVSKDKIFLSSGPDYMTRISLNVPISCYRKPETLKFGDVFRLTGNINEIDPVRSIELENPKLELLT